VKSTYLTALVWLAGALGCPKVVPSVVERGPADAGVDPLRLRLDAIEAEAAEVLRAQDEALWSHWTTGAALDLARATAGHDALFSRACLDELRAARAALPAPDARRAAHLERWLVGELLAKELAAENDAVASLEAGLTFFVDGKEVAWRDLPRLLRTEKSAVKRRALWKASLVAAERLDAALARRDLKAAELAMRLGSPSVLELAAEARELDLDELARTAETVLATTDDAWRAALQRQSDADMRLPLANLTRAELPRLVRVSPAADAAFPKEQIAPRAVAVLASLGLYGRPGLTLDLSERSSKHPLPLTVAPVHTDVRVSFLPVGGLRDQASLFSELGTALALREASTGHLATDRLGDPASAQVLADLFSGLVGLPAWLTSVGVDAVAQQAVQEAWAVHRLFVLRRAAGVVLVRLETQGLPDAEARERYVHHMSRALALPPSAEDGVRWRIDTDDFLRSATTLKAAALSNALAARLPEDWFARKDVWPTIAARWRRGTEAPLEQRMGLAPGPWGSPERVASSDGGLRPGPWPAPSTAVTAASSGDGGLHPGPWPVGAAAALDAGAEAARDAGGPRPDAGPADGAALETGPVPSAGPRDGG
jgi:hypothetical protein